MSRPGGRRARAIEGLAAALQECFDASIEAAEKRFEPRFARQDEILRHVKETQRQQNETLKETQRQQSETQRQQNETQRRHDETLRQQNDTLRMIWTQCGGKPERRLPVDD